MSIFNPSIKRTLEMASPKIVAFEGIDGSGKSTSLKAFSENLTQLGIDHVCLQMIPAGSIREAIMYDETLTPNQRASLFIVAAETVKEQISQAKDKGQWVLLDRSVLSNYVYQGHLDDKMVFIKSLIDVFGPIRKPDILIFHAVPPYVAEDRIKERDGKRDHFENLDGLSDRLENEVQGYITELDNIRQQDRLTKVIEVDGCSSIEEIQEEIILQIVDHISL